MTPLMVRVPGDPGCHAICATRLPEPSTLRQSYAVPGVRSISPRLTLSVVSLSKPPGKDPDEHGDCGPSCAFAYQYGRSTVGFEITGGLVPTLAA